MISLLQEESADDFDISHGEVSSRKKETASTVLDLRRQASLGMPKFAKNDKKGLILSDRFITVKN